MAQTFYIEADEEIISVVGRLRHTNDAEIVLVVPKHAILMQSIVSLKLLEREAKKIGKTIMVVSQDDNGRALAEKAGLLTRSYQEEQARHEEPTGKQRVAEEPLIFNAPEPTVSFAEPKAPYALKPENIGSESFFAPSEQKALALGPVAPISHQGTPPTNEVAPPLRVSIRDTSPKFQTALNSKRDDALLPSSPYAMAKALPETPSFAAAPKSFSPPEVNGVVTPPSNTFFAPPSALRKEPVYAPVAPVQLPTAIHTRVKLMVAGIGILVLCLIGGVSFFLFTPKATITVLPSYTTERSAFELKLISSATDSGEAAIDASTLEVPYRVIDDTVDVPLSLSPTGVGTSGERKAHGKVVIYNSFSANPQPLVATTRIETATGMIFRLTEGVTVPGMTTIAGKETPGAIEAEIVADQSGDSANISATTFTIPGFKGNAKYDKFSVKSLTPTSGGSKNGAIGDSLLTVSDIEQGKRLAHDRAIDMFRQKTDGTLRSGEKIEESGVELTVLPEEPLLHEGLSGTSIDTVFHFRVKAYVVSTDVVERAILRILSTSERRMMNTGIPLIPKNVTIDTSNLIPDFTLGGGKLLVTASFLLATDIQTDILQGELLGKQADELRGILDSHPEIVKMNLDIKPNIFLKYIPKDRSRVTVVVAGPEQE